MSNSNNKSNTPSSKIDGEMEEEETINHFFHLIQHKLATSHYLEDLLLGGGYDDSDYQAEKALLMDVNNNGLREGMIAGATTFVCLVVGPPLIRRFIPPKTYQLDTPTKMRSKLGKYLLMGARLGIQTAASLVIAAYTTSYFTDEDFMLQQVARAPLLEGRSVISDEFCKDFSKEYYQCHSQEYWKNVQSPYLQQLRVFVENCEKRKSFEKSLRKEQGLLPDTPVSIPPPGVPKEYPIDEDVKNEYSGFSGTDEMDKEWVETIVMDQEEDFDDKKN